MKEDIKKYIPLLSRIVILCMFFLGIYIICTSLIQYILPFLLSWIIASIIEPIICFLTIRFKLSRNMATFMVILGFVLLIGSILVLIGSVIILELTQLSIQLPEYSKKLYAYSIDWVEKMESLYIILPSDIALSMLNGFNSLLNNLSLLMGRFISSLLSFLSGIPNFLLFVVVTILSTFFMARDKKEIKTFFIGQISQGALRKGRILKADLFSALMGYIKAQMILMFITFIESAVGLVLIGIDYAVLIALIASIIDALPILGTGFIYIPLIILNLLSNNYPTAMHLGVLYGMIIMVRQFLEPKILGKEIGLYPLVTLISMYIGLKLWGIWGLILGPVLVILFITLQKIDFIPKWK